MRLKLVELELLHNTAHTNGNTSLLFKLIFIFPDPPDEIIERVPPSIQYSQPAQAGNAAIFPPSPPSFLCSVIATIRSDGAFKLRTLIGVFYSLILTIVTEFYALSFSYIVAMLIMELTLLVAITMVSKSDGSGVRGDWILQLRGILTFLHPLFPDIFEFIYLSLYIIAIVLRDLVIMIFSIIVFKSIMAITVQS